MPGSRAPAFLRLTFWSGRGNSRFLYPSLPPTVLRGCPAGALISVPPVVGLPSGKRPLPSSLLYSQAWALSAVTASASGTRPSISSLCTRRAMPRPRLGPRYGVEAGSLGHRKAVGVPGMAASAPRSGEEVSEEGREGSWGCLHTHLV